jgi:Ribonuclease G/E
MDLPVPDRVHSAVRKLRKELEGEVQGLIVRRAGLERELQEVVKDLDSRQRMLELVKATETQLAGQGPGQRDVEGGRSGGGTQVRGFCML